MAGQRSILHKSVIDQVNKIGQADILVGIPSFRDADTITYVISTASEGIAKYFPGLKGVIVNSCGGGERCDTREAALKAPVDKGVEKIVTHYSGLTGKGSAFRTIFEIADRLKARICITLDADLRSITPHWIQLLGEPVYRYNFGFVTPNYLRHKHDGTITNALAYPLTRALYGLRVRQPIGGEFGFTGALTKIFSHQPVWDTDIARFGIDIWMITTAITEGFRICQASMGVKLHDPKDPTAELGPMFRQVVGTLFALMGEHEVKWKAIKGSVPVHPYGGAPRRRELKEPEPPPFKVIERFKAGARTHEVFWRKCLHPDNYQQVMGIAALEPEAFMFPEELWARVVYDFAITYNFSGEDLHRIVGALTPLYFARIAAFMLESQGMSEVMVEALIEGEARVFEEYKPYLIKRWDEAKRKHSR